MNKIQEYRGVRGLVAAEVLEDTASGITFGTPFVIAGVAELTKTVNESSESHFYDNYAAVTVYGDGSDEIGIKASAIPFDVLGNITGQHYDEAKGMLVEGKREEKYFALGYITEKTDGTEVYVWRLKGSFAIPGSTHVTKDDGTTANGQELTYTNIYTKCRFSFGGKNERAKAVNVDASKNPVDENVFFEEVQTPETIPMAV